MNKILDAYMRNSYSERYISSVSNIPSSAILISTYVYNDNKNHYDKIFISSNNDVYRFRVWSRTFVARVILS
jgi:hypothetical protein